MRLDLGELQLQGGHYLPGSLVLLNEQIQVAIDDPKTPGCDLVNVATSRAIASRPVTVREEGVDAPHTMAAQEFHEIYCPQECLVGFAIARPMFLAR
jgi:hypothetical protein